jgi:single-stranded-DNA-specific exonuclease
VIVFTRAEDGSYKGSGRSVDGVHLRDVLVEVDRRTDNRIMLKYGGHAMAAGMSLRSEFFEEFKQVFDQEVKKVLSSIEPIIYTDGILEPEHLKIETAKLIDSSGPWGQHFPRPLYRGDFVILERRVLKGRHLKMKLRPVSGGEPVDAICFFCLDSEDALMPENTVIRMAYELSVNSFRGNETLQLMIKDFDVNTQIIN